MDKPSSVDEYLATLPEQLRDVGAAVAAIIDAELPEADGGVVWHGHPVWRIDAAPVCLLKAYQSYVTFAFWRGQELDDPDGALDPGARQMAHVKVRTASDIDAEIFARWLRQGRELELDLTGLPVAVAGRPSGQGHGTAPSPTRVSGATAADPSRSDTRHIGDDNMRKVVLGMNASLDGFVSGPNGQLDWMFRTMDPAQSDVVVDFLRGVDTVLIGGTIYLEQAAFWPSQEGDMADLLNGHTKIVFSSSLDGVDWQNSRLAEGPPAEEIARLKDDGGKTVFVTGGATLARTLSTLGLIDEYHLFVHPILLGSGKRLFGEQAEPVSLKLVDTRAFGTGALQLTYRTSEHDRG